MKKLFRPFIDSIHRVYENKKFCKYPQKVNAYLS